jgi:hypothetical protein
MLILQKLGGLTTPPIPPLATALTITNKTISIFKSFIKAYYLFKRTVSGFKYRTNFITVVRVYSQSCLMFFSKGIRNCVLARSYTDTEIMKLTFGFFKM